MGRVFAAAIYTTMILDTPWQQRSKEVSFLRSAMTLENRYQSLSAFLEWFEQRKVENYFAVKPIPFSDSQDWYFDEDQYRLRHRSGKFFSIEGIEVQTNYGHVNSWDQPIINQPEIGILGIITRVVDGVRYCLMQAKMEPGNINTLQISPTVQATKSNYTKIHEGNAPHYLEYFVLPDKAHILVDQLQSEQGGRFYQKRNRNMVVEVDEDIPTYDEFRWLTLGEIKELLKIDDLVNMDSRTVLSCIPYVSPEWRFYYQNTNSPQSVVSAFDHQLDGFPRDLFLSMLASGGANHTLDEIISWFTNLKTHYEMRVKRIALSDLQHWQITDWDIHHETKKYFSVINVAVEAGNREVVNWTQPILKHSCCGVVGFLTQRINGTLHFLVRAVLEPGTRDMIEMGPTVAYSNPDRWQGDQETAAFLSYFLQPNPDTIRYSTVQSEEGGRFYHFQNRYMIVDLPESEIQDLPPNYIWMTLGQIIDFTKYSYFNIEARNLFSCLNLMDS